MRKRLIAWSVLLSILFSSLTFFSAYAEENGMVRVWLTRLGTASAITIRPTCDYYVADQPLYRISSGTSATFTLSNGTISMNYDGSTVSLGSTVRLNREQSGKEGVVFTSSSSSNRYCGDVILNASSGGILIVLDIYVEDYLYGVVGYEMSPSYSLEALKAQAIAARNYALKKRRSREKYTYDLVDTSSNQVFKGLNTSSSYANVIRAVDETRGQVLYYGSSLANCYYTASNGGQTESTKNAWGSALAYSIVQDDPYDFESSGKKKTATIRRDAENLNADLESALQNGVRQAAESNGVSVANVRIDSIDSIALTSAKYSEPSRLYQTALFTVTATVRNTAGESATGSCEVKIPTYGGLETWYGLSINSGNNETVWLNADESAFTILTGRNGHGIGLSQTGAQVMAKKYGKTCAEILEFYYPGCVLKTLSLADSTAKANLPDAIATGRTGEKCALYAEAQANAEKITTLESGATIRIYAVSGEWAAVSCGNTAGYIPVNAISACIPIGESAQSVQDLTAMVNADDSALLALPIEGASAVGKLSKGTVVNVYAYTANWAAITTDSGLHGYIGLSKLTANRQSTPEPTATPTPEPTATVYTLQGEWYAKVNRDAVSLNKSASEDSDILQTLAKGEYVRVYAYSAEWASVETSDGNQGFVPLNSLTLQTKPTATPTPEPTMSVYTLQGEWYAKVNRDGVTLYRSTSKDSDILQTLAKNESVRVYAYTENWAAVETSGGNQGFVSLNTLTLQTQTTATPTPAPTPVPTASSDKVYKLSGKRYAQVIASEAILYSDAADTSSALATLQKGDTVRVYAYNSTWVATETENGTKGFVGIRALQLIAQTDNTPQGGKVRSVRGTVYRYVASDSVKMYSTYSTSASVMTELPYGTRVQIGCYNSIWACVKANGQIGFVNVDALSAKSPVSKSASDVIRAEFNAETQADTDVYNQPNSVIGMFAKGTRVRVYAYNNAYAYVRSGEYSGFVAIKDLRIVV